MRTALRFLALSLLCLMLLAAAGCRQRTSDTLTPAGIEDHLIRAIGTENYLCDRDISDEDLKWKFDLDFSRIKSYIARHNHTANENLDIVVIMESDPDYIPKVVEQLNVYFGKLIPYTIKYGCDVEKAAGGRIYVSGSFVAFIVAGRKAVERMTVVERKALADAEYKKIDDAWIALFGSLPENLAGKN